MQDGLKTFANYCMGCHSAKFKRYERVASDLGIPEEVMMDNIVFADAKFGDHMKIGMKPEDAKVWFGAARRISPWLLVFVATTGCIPTCAASMKIRLVRTASTTACSPMLVCRMFSGSAQGRRVVGCKQVQVVENGRKQFDPLTGTPITQEACDQMVVEPGTGSLSEAEYDEKIKNLVTFPAYSANPVKLESQRIGTYVLLFLAVFFVFAYLLKREYWKDVH